jgi:hypothetical protein
VAWGTTSTSPWLRWSFLAKVLYLWCNWYRFHFFCQPNSELKRCALLWPAKCICWRPSLFAKTNNQPLVNERFLSLSLKTVVIAVLFVDQEFRAQLLPAIKKNRDEINWFNSWTNHEWKCETARYIPRELNLNGTAARRLIAQGTPLTRLLLVRTSTEFSLVRTLTACSVLSVRRDYCDVGAYAVVRFGYLNRLL